MSFDDHPLRYALTNELHARPFPSLAAPGQAIYLAIKEPSQAVKRDRSRDRAHLIALLDRFGAQHPTPDATHYYGDLGKFHLKWEQHTEFVTYTAFVQNGLSRPFDPAAWEVFPEDWLAEIPGTRITSAHLMYQPAPEDEAEIEPMIHEWFVPESLAVSRVLDDTAVIAGRFPDRQYRASALRHLQPARYRAIGAWAASCSASARSRPTRPCRCWACRGRATSPPSGADRRAPVASGHRHDGRSVETRRDAGPASGHFLGAGEAADRKRLPLRGDGGLRRDRHAAGAGPARRAVSRAPDLRGVHDAPVRSGDAYSEIHRGAAGDDDDTRDPGGGSAAGRGSMWTARHRTRNCWRRWTADRTSRCACRRRSRVCRWSRSPITR
jgi:hypothetical protein